MDQQPTYQNSQPPLPSQAPVPQPKSNTALLVGLIGGGVALLLALIVAAIVYVMVYRVTPANYRDAVSGTNQVVDAVNEFSDATDEYSIVADRAYVTDASLKTAEDELIAKYTAYKQKADSLAELKALQRDKQAKQLYENYKDKNQKLIAYEDEMVEVLPISRKMIVACGELSDDGKMSKIFDDPDAMVEAYDAATNDCISSIDELAAVKNSDAQAIGKELQALFTEMRGYIVEMHSAYVAKDLNALYAASDKIEAMDSSKIDELSNKFMKQEKELSPVSELNKLIDYLDSKQG